MKTIVSRYHHSREFEQFSCGTHAEAAAMIKEGNACAAKGWHWGLSDINFMLPDGTEMTVEEANAIRRSCGCFEW